MMAQQPIENADLKTETGLKKAIEEIKKAYKNKDFETLELYYNKLLELKFKNRDDQLKDSEQQLLAENLVRYFSGAMYLFHTENVPKENHEDKYERATTRLEYIKFEDDELFKHIEEIGITEKEQRILLNFCYIGKNINYLKGSADKIDDKTIFCFINKDITEYLSKDPKILEIFKKIMNTPIPSHNPEKILIANINAYLHFIKGYLYDTGNKTLNINIDIEKAKECYANACEIKYGNNQCHPGTLLLKAKDLEVEYNQTKAMDKLEIALKIYQDLAEERFTTASNYCQKDYYYSANLAAGNLSKLFSGLKTEMTEVYLQKAVSYFEKASESPIYRECAEAVRELYLLAIENNDKSMEKYYRERLKNMDVLWIKQFKAESGATANASFHHTTSNTPNTVDNNPGPTTPESQDDTPKYT